MRLQIGWLMVLTSLAPAPVTEPDITVRLVSPDEPELDRIWAVPAVAFGHPGTRPALAGAIEPDKIAADHDEGTMDLLRHVSFVDCPGHDILMSTMLSGAAVMVSLFR